MNKLHLIVLAVMAMIIGGCASQLISENDEFLYLSSIQKGNVLAQAIDRYHEIELSYPDDLAALIPKYISRVPVPDEYFSGFHYMTFGSQDWYKGKPTYSLSLRKKTGFSLIWPNSYTYFKYDPENQVVDNQKTDVHFREGDWVYITRHRHAIGEAGRIE